MISSLRVREGKLLLDFIKVYNINKPISSLESQ